MTRRFEIINAPGVKQVDPKDVLYEKQLSKPKYAEIFSQEEGPCAYCYVEMYRFFRIKQKVTGDKKQYVISKRSDQRTVDHIIPISAGGKNLPDNRLFCCEKCNLEKGSMSLEDFLEQRSG